MACTNELQLILYTLSSYIHSLASDLELAKHVASSVDFQRECVAKMDSDAAGFMRLSLRMYNMDSVSCDNVQEIHGMALLVQSFILNSIDVAMNSPECMSFMRSSLGVLREHTVLLHKALVVLAEEMVGGGTKEAAAVCDDGSRKRGRTAE